MRWRDAKEILQTTKKSVDSGGRKEYFPTSPVVAAGLRKASPKSFFEALKKSC
jgi:hypothetical protein